MFVRSEIYIRELNNKIQLSEVHMHLSTCSFHDQTAIFSCFKMTMFIINNLAVHIIITFSIHMALLSLNKNINPPHPCKDIFSIIW